MNKFLNRRTRGYTEERPQPKRKNEWVPSAYPQNLEVLHEFAACYYSLETARQKMRRSVMYAYENQWGDIIKDPDSNEVITEAELIKRQGKQPLKTNMISPILKNIDGQFRGNITESICRARDPKETKVGEMMTVAVNYVHDINDMNERDSDSLRYILLAGFMAQRTEYGWNMSGTKKDVWVYGCTPSRLFFNSNIEDPLGRDLTHIGEIFDMPLGTVQSIFSRSPREADMIADLYEGGDKSSTFYTDGLQGEQTRNADFYTPFTSDMCRVIFGWRLETRDSYEYHDFLTGTWGFVKKEEKAKLDMENQRRMDEAVAHGMSEEDVLTIQYRYSRARYWKYYYLTPWGDVLREGESPYWHHEHNYTLMLHTLVDGKVFNFLEDFIDQQRVINRTLMMIDFVRSSTSKGLLIVDDQAFADMTHREIVDEYVRYNGVLFVKLKPGQNIQNVIHQVNGNAAVQGDFELLNLQLKLINEIAGVNSAMQGKTPTAGTAASLYAQQVENSATNLKGLFGSFNTFRKRRDIKVMQTIQQYYTQARHIDLSGRNYSEEAKYYNPQKVQGAEIDLTLTQGQTPAYQAMVDDLLMRLFDKQAIDVLTMLENSSLPGKERIIESINRSRQSGEMQQVPMPQNMNPLMQQAMNDAYASPQDGLVQRAAA